MICRRCGSGKKDYDGYKSSRHSTRVRRVNKLESVNTNLSKALNYKNYRLMKYSQEYNRYISERWQSRASESIYRQSRLPLTPRIRYIFCPSYTTWSRNVSQIEYMKKRTCSFQYFVKDPFKTAGAHYIHPRRTMSSKEKMHHRLSVGELFAGQVLSRRPNR